MEQVNNIFDQIVEFLNLPLVTLGNITVTAWKVFYVVLLFVLLVYLTKKIKKWIIHSLLSKSNLDIGIRTTIGTMFRYMMIVIGFMIIFQSAGIDLSTITVLAGAMGVGIGFGLQNVTNNFVSGLIILFERPIKVGDRI